mmetsp:Transcript_12674/g.28298  ORF Transcript_12674/g.28298 Transcript_12674/m.28298 type:complete len:211 (+) Transcript_12674:330-962(+)
MSNQPRPGEKDRLRECQGEFNRFAKWLKRLGFPRKMQNWSKKNTGPFHHWSSSTSECNVSWPTCVNSPTVGNLMDFLNSIKSISPLTSLSKTLKSCSMELWLRPSRIFEIMYENSSMSIVPLPSRSNHLNNVPKSVSVKPHSTRRSRVRPMRMIRPRSFQVWVKASPTMVIGIAMYNTPHIAMILQMNRPRSVSGEMSPYPTVDNVITTR